MRQRVNCLFERQTVRKIDAARKTKEEDVALAAQQEPPGNS
jgi:hypothetical protein